ncbi:MAG: gfo/Idh/MocA family oxidoreductase [Bacteroidetes bacterium]|nr:MAG: gfo/Idh/MocA family oxidoreductase [Bacteroidota bacterium]
MSASQSRRQFIKTTAVVGTGASLLGAPAILRGQDDRKVRLAVIGTGLRGRWHLKLALDRSDTEVKALCDIDGAALDEARRMVEAAGQPKPATYGAHEESFRQLLEQEELDAVVIATPWLWHTPMAVAAMKAGIVPGLEVPAAVTVEECWDLVDTSEATGVPCMMLENVCYRRDVMAVLNMVRQGLFGELLHLECGYQHDLRAVKFNDGKQPYGGGVEFGEKGFSEARWRTAHSVHRNGDLYPTHGIGPVATMLDINRGNRFAHLTATATKSRGLHKFIVDHGGPDHPNAAVDFKLGDIVTSVIQTVNGETITVQHDTNSPRPYSLGFRVQGTQGIWMDLNESLYIEGRSPEAHRWEAAAPYLEEYDHPLWRRYAAEAEGGGHGGMDFFVLHAFIESVKQGVQPPLGVYDAAAWSVIAPLSEASIASGSEPLPFPDFTRGRWMRRQPAFALGDAY